jgi:hypothetical protein
MDSTVTMGWDILDRMERAVAKVRDRLLRATAALNAANIPYAVVGGHAVASWVAKIDEGAVRNTRDVDLMVRRDDLPAVTAALEAAGFERAEVLDVLRFLDGENAKPSEAIQVLLSGERTRPDLPLPAPELTTVDDPAGFRVLELSSLVRMQLSSNRNENRMLVRDMVDAGLVNTDWVPKLLPVLAERLKQILETPEG